MRSKWRDVAATLLVTAVVVLYVGYLVHGSGPLIADMRGMVTVGLILGWASRVIGGRSTSRSDSTLWIVMASGLVTLGLGTAAGSTQNAGLLAGFVASIVVLWAFAAWRRPRSVVVTEGLRESH